MLQPLPLKHVTAWPQRHRGLIPGPGAACGSKTILDLTGAVWAVPAPLVALSVL